MAKADIATPPLPLRPAGVDDAQPIAQSSLAFFRQRGFAIQFGQATRMNGKLLLLTYAEPILAIHSDERNGIWIQTRTELLYLPDFFHAFL